MKKRGLFYIVLLSIFLSMLIIQTSNFVRALEIDETIITKLENQTEVPVIILLKDNSNLRYLPTMPKQERFNVLQDKKQYFKEIQKNVLTTLSVSDLKIKYIYSTIPGFAGNITKSGLDKLKINSNVLSIGPDRVGTYILQESLPLINATKVWELQINGKNITGIGQTICVIDSGVDYTHPDLGGCNQTQFLSGNCSKVISGYDFESDDSDPMDEYGHGTHVAGIVAANGSINGVAHGAKIVALKIGGPTWEIIESTVVAAVDWCYDNSTKFNISVMQMSLQLNKYSCNPDCYNDTALSQVINEAYEYGIFIDDASGNDGYTNQINYPACIKGVTSVGATYDADVGYQNWWPICTDSTTYANKLVCFTDRCEILDLLAPGSVINSTQLGGGYVEMSGTSMAAPHVAGAAALLFQINNSLTPDDIEQILNETGVFINDPETGLNFSRIDVYNATKKLIITSFPKINQIQCHNSTTWVNCSKIIYKSNLTQVRVNCTSPYNHTITNASFKLENIPDNSIFFNNNATSNQSDWWIYDNNDIIINDSGEFNLTVTCFDNENKVTV